MTQTSLSPAQLRAARALLNWSRLDLSKLSGISEPSIHRYETGITSPASRIRNKLFEVFDAHGVEFSPRNGVCFKSSEVEIFQGKDRFDDFYDFLYDHLNQFGGDVCVVIYDQMLLIQARKEPTTHNKRMKKLFDQGKISFRILTTISNFNTHGYAQIRWLPDMQPTPTSFYAFGNCLALISLLDQDSPYVVVVRSRPLADGYRVAFETSWQSGKKPPPPEVITKMLESYPSECR